MHGGASRGKHRPLKFDVDTKDDGLEDLYRLLSKARLDINVKFQGKIMD